jgi:RNA polymerase sigma-70 factor (ECF subfamily)
VPSLPLPLDPTPAESADLVTDEVELLERWRTGDVRAGSALFERCFAPIYRFFVNKTRTPDDTAELTQNTFLALVSARDRFAGSSSFLTYALGVAHNLLIGYYRELTRDNARFDPLTSSIIALGAGAQTQLECVEVQELLVAALRAIPADFQIALELYYVEGLDPAAIAETLGINANTVRSRIARGREQLRDQMTRLASQDGLAVPGDDDWPRLIKAAFPVHVLSASFRRDS